jgi:Uma2 family endonuclease
LTPRRFSCNNGFVDRVVPFALRYDAFDAMSTSPQQSVPSGDLPAGLIRRFSVDEYHSMGTAGVLSDDDNVELLEGLVVRKMIRSPQHDATIGLVEQALRSRLNQPWLVRIQSAITTSDSEPEPDVAVVRGPVRRYLDSHPGPGDVSLVIEVADSSLALDRVKGRLYACAAIPRYWIVNLVDRQVEVYSSPGSPAENAGYGERRDFGPSESLPVIVDEQQAGDAILVVELLP